MTLENEADDGLHSVPFSHDCKVYHNQGGEPIGEDGLRRILDGPAAAARSAAMESYRKSLQNS